MAVPFVAQFELFTSFRSPDINSHCTVLTLLQAPGGLRIEKYRASHLPAARALTTYLLHDNLLYALTIILSLSAQAIR